MKKGNYYPPKIEVNYIFMEEGIASGSAQVDAISTSESTIQEEWTKEEILLNDVEW